MSRNSVYVRVLLVVIVLAVLVSFLGRASHPAARDAWLPSSFNPVGAGSLAFYDTLEDLNWPVARWREPLSRLTAQGADNALVITRSAVNWREAFTPQEAQLLDTWVKQGNTLLLLGPMAKWDDTRQLLGEFGFNVPKSHDAPPMLVNWRILAGEKKVAATPGAYETRQLVLPEGAQLPIGYPLGARVLWWNGGAPAVIEIDRGKGRVVCVASAQVLDNHYLDEGDNLAIVLQLLAPDGHVPRHLFFEESHHGFTTTFAIVKLINHPGVRLALVLALLGAATFFGSAFVRFGPVLPLDREPGRSSLEFIDSIAELYHRSDLRNDMIGFLFKETHKQIVARLNLPPTAPHELIASRLKQAHPELPGWKKLAQRFDSHDYTAGLPPGGWLRVARELIQIKNALAVNSLLSTRAAEIRQEIRKVIVGQETVVENTLIALLAGGHVILEGVPGLAKTLFARALAATLALNFKRIQFTPDLMPSDLVGTNVFQPDTQTFKFLAGPIFADVLLADEINRTPPKTQSALLEAMEEYQVTVDGVSRALPEHFFVIATQNPIEYEGTFPLPEAQTDRFLFKIKVDYPTPADELALLQQTPFARGVEELIKPVASVADFAAIRREIEAVKIEAGIYDYTLRLVIASRQSPQLLLGASPRAGRAWLRAARVLACLRERAFVTPDDIKELAYPVLRHRLVRQPETEIEGTPVERVIDQLLASVEIPR